MGFESINQEALKNVKKINVVKKYGNLMRKLKAYRIVIAGLFVLGIDGDDKNVFTNTLNFCNKNGIPLAFFQILRPLPGTPLFDKMKKENRILTYDWGKYTGVVFKPKNMSVKELEDGRFYLSLKFYSLKNIFKNLLNLFKFRFPFYTYLIAVHIYMFTYFSLKREQLFRLFGRTSGRI